jgi:hypothetical protein
MSDEIKYILFRDGGLILVEYGDGTFGIQRDGVPLPTCRWENQRLCEGVRAFRDIELRLLDDRNLSRAR